MAEDDFVPSQEYNTVWWHVGRFLYEFALLETSINEAFEVLFNMRCNATLYNLLVPRLGFMDKVELIKEGLKRKGMNIKGLQGDICKFAEVRNIVAHSAFGADDRAGDRGISFDYLSRGGNAYFSDRVRKLVGEDVKDSSRSYGAEWDAMREIDRENRKKGGNEAKDSCITLEDSFISYDAFSDLDRSMKHLRTSVSALAGACAPLSDEDLDEETIKRMKDALNRNVLPGNFRS
jgi:hypothetical protein